MSAFVPTGLVAGVATGTEGTKARMATGDYNKKLAEKSLKSKCSVALNN